MPSPEREQFQGEPGELAICKLDLSSLVSVRKCVTMLMTSETKINILINNAGVMMCPQQKTEDGYELQLQSNHLGHFLLTLLLLPKIKSSAPGCRIINVSSIGHVRGRMHFDDLNFEKSYTPFKAYVQSKLANILFTKGLSRKLKDSGIEGVNTYALHPGIISTELGRHIDKSIGMKFFMRLCRPFIKTPVLGAQTTIHCAVDENAANETGLYYKECAVASPSILAENQKDAEKLWVESLKMVGLPPHTNLSELL